MNLSILKKGYILYIIPSFMVCPMLKSEKSVTSTKGTPLFER